MSPVPGWYPDPATPDQLRLWDGEGWTEQVRAASPPPSAYAAPVPAPLAEPAPEAWGDGGYWATGATDLATRPAATARYAGPPCQACGAGPSAELKLNRLRGLLILFVATTIRGRWCRDCAVGPFRAAQNFTLAWGWWGLFTLFLTPAALILNARQLHLARRLPAPSGRVAPPIPSGQPLGERAGLWVAVVLLPLILIVIAVRGK